MGSVIGTLLLTMVLVVVAIAAAPWRARARERDADTQASFFQAPEGAQGGRADGTQRRD